MFLPEKLHFPVKRCGANRCVDFIEGIHCKLDKETKMVLNKLYIHDI